MDELIARLEAAEKGSRELDARVGVATGIGGRIGTDVSWQEGKHWREGKGKRLEDAIRDWPESAATIAIFWNVPQFTTSLDAARALLLEGWRWVKPMKNTEKEVIQVYPTEWDESKPWGDWLQTGTAATVELAFCSAALKARQEKEPGPCRS